jgi:voltage-gated potassium channel
VPDLAILALPALRPLRLLRVVMLLRVLNRGAIASLRGRIAVYVCGATGILLFCSALAVLDAERPQPGANITGFGDALWWAVTTITTVGYGDYYPVTATGRWVAAGLMLGGIALLGVVSASIASWLIDRVRETEEDVQAATRADVRALTDEVAQLRTELAALRHDAGRG